MIFIFIVNENLFAGTLVEAEPYSYTTNHSGKLYLDPSAESPIPQLTKSMLVYEWKREVYRTWGGDSSVP